MNKLRSIIVANSLFFTGFLFFFTLGLVFLLTSGKAATFLYLNPYHHNRLDTFFVYFTYLGDGIFTIIIFLILLFLRRWSQAWQVMTAFLVSSLVAQVLKNLFSMPRPKQFFDQGQYPYFIDGVTHVGFSSFPSGHSVSIFALVTLLALFEKNKKWNIAYLLGAVAVGYSRIYLGQHFLGDVLVGSFIGVSSSVLIHWFFTPQPPEGGVIPPAP
ncbi:phosphatase PAP2 family protein [Flavitalea flava]